MFCMDNRSLLRRFGIHYPVIDDRIQHSSVLWKAQKDGIETLGAFFAACFAQAKSACHTVLLSSEDFENCIVDVALASEIEALAYAAGFDALEWVVVTRPSVEYVASLYAEMSKHGVVLDHNDMHKSARERGCLYVSSHKYNYIFVLDFARFAERFQRLISGQVVKYEFKDFITDYPGSTLLQRLLPDDAFAQFRKSAKISDRQENERLNLRQVEAHYVSSALGLPRLRYNKFFLFAAPFVWLRLRKSKAHQDSEFSSG